MISVKKNIEGKFTLFILKSTSTATLVLNRQLKSVGSINTSYRLGSLLQDILLILYVHHYIP